MTDGQISKLIGTTKFTITQIRDRSHWNISNVAAKDPVMLGLCKQNELASAITKARRSSRWKAMQENMPDNKDSINASLKYGLVRKEDHIVEEDTALENNDVNSFFQKAASPEER